jgi:polyisoprenoid-binding protein YceI
MKGQMTAMKFLQSPTVCFALLGVGALLSASAAHHVPLAHTPSTSATIVLTLDPARSTLHYTADSTLHTVHGTFALKRGTLCLDSATGKASGEIVVDATSGYSGNGSRDQKMHKEFLDSGRYTEIVFRPVQVDGNIAQRGISTLRVHGIFALHGSEHELDVPVRAELQVDSWKGAASFSVPYVQWGLKNPSNFLLKVNRSVEVDLEMAGSLKAAQSATAERQSLLGP